MTIQSYANLPTMHQFYFEAMCERLPMVVRLGDFSGMGWRTDRWDVDYLDHKAGSQTVKVMHRKDPSSDYQPENTEYVDVVFRQFLQDTMRQEQGSDEWYLNLQGYSVMSPPLLQLVGDFSIPEFYRELPIRCINLWLGKSKSGITTALHHDFDDNVYAVVKGEKHISLFNPQLARKLYPRGQVTDILENGMIRYHDMRNQHMPHFSQVNPDDPDYDRFPDYKSAEEHKIDIKLSAGDLLYIPCGWFHQVNSLPGEHIALSFFATPPEQNHIDLIRQHKQQQTGS